MIKVVAGKMECSAFGMELGRTMWVEQSDLNGRKGDTELSVLESGILLC